MSEQNQNNQKPPYGLKDQAQDGAPKQPKEQNAVQQAAAEQSQPVRISADDERDILLRSLMAREARQAKEEMAQEEALLARKQQRELNTQNRNEKSFARQQRCQHLKGGKIKSKTGIKDYALFHHTYIDKTQTIGCFICKMRWKPGDTTEFLVRRGRKIRNHTKTGWLEANEMFSQSSNTPSMSEIPQTINAGAYLRGGEDIGPAEVQ